MSVTYKIKEFPSSVVCTIADDATPLVYTVKRSIQKSNAYAFKQAGDDLGISISQPDNGSYNKFTISDWHDLEITNILGVTETEADWADQSECIDAINLVLQQQVSLAPSPTGLPKDVEIVRMCDLHGCSDPKAIIAYDGAGGNPLSISGTYNGNPGLKIRKVDWGDGTITNHDGTAAAVHTYAANNCPFTAQIRVIAQDPATDAYCIIVGSLLIEASGGSTSGTFETNQISGSSKWIPFLRHFVYNADGTLDSHFDTDLSGVDYEASDFVREECCDCEDDDFYTFNICDNNFALLADDSGNPLTTTLDYGKYNLISILIVLGTGVEINGNAYPLGYLFVIELDQPFAGEIEILTDASNKATLTTQYKVSL